jgi:hypothetical protein
MADRALKPAICGAAAESPVSATLDSRIANQENEVSRAKPVAALSASRMKAAVIALLFFHSRSANAKSQVRAVELQQGHRPLL